MAKNITSILCPPLAVCRYGCAGYCAAPIGVAWMGGITLVVYHFFTQAHLNYLTEFGSLILGLAAISLSIIWTKLTIKQVERDESKNKGKHSPLCKIIPRFYENDPLEDVEKLKEL